MKLKKYQIKILYSILFCMVFSDLFGQTSITVKGRVLDQFNVPIPGAVINVKNEQQGTVADLDGRFQINVPSKESILIISFLGYVSQEIPINGRSTVDAILQEDAKSLKEVVVTGYVEQAKPTITGAITTVSGEQLVKSPVTNVTQALAGRTPGVLTNQASGKPGQDLAEISIRGNGGALILVDGVERPLGDINMEDIDQFTILKDAATTAVYGIRGGNGVILITTKRGKIGRPKISYSSNASFDSPTRLPKQTNGYDYATLYNEAARNDNPNITDNALPYPSAVLDVIKNNSNPTLFASTDWFDLMMKKTALRTNNTLNVSGGTEKTKYFFSLGYLNQGGLWKEFNEQFGYSNNNDYNRFNFRSNLDFNLSENSKLSFSIGGNTGKEHDGAGNTIFRDISNSNPFSIGIVGDKLINNTFTYTRNPLTELSSGYTDLLRSTLNLTADFSQKLDFIINGLSFRTKIGYDSYYVVKNSRSISRTIYRPVPIQDNGRDTIVYFPENDQSIGGEGDLKFSDNSRNLYAEGGLQYKHSFNKHNINVLGLGTMRKNYWHNKEYTLVPIGYLGLVGDIKYNYDSKYLAAVSVGYQGSEQFIESDRYGFFPAVSVGWNMHREQFFKDIFDKSKIISQFKITASYGETGTDVAGSNRFLYFPTPYDRGSKGVYFGEERTQYPYVREGQAGNAALKWAVTKKTNVSLETGFFADRLNATVSYFIDNKDGILKAPESYAHLGALLSPLYNLGHNKNKGVELELRWASKIGNFNYFIEGNYIKSRNIALQSNFPLNPTAPNTYRVGQLASQPFGYIAMGMFNTPEEIAAAPLQFGSVPTLGDVRYKDVNGDGAVTPDDVAPIGSPTFPGSSFGFNLGFNFKGFDFSALFSGANDVSYFIDSFWQKPGIAFSSILQEVVAQRWTPDNLNATRPKLSITYSNEANYYQSTLWQRDASYVKLRNVDFGYTFSNEFLKKVKIARARLFLSGQNLFIWDSLELIDPENRGSGNTNFAYPQAKTYNMGLNVTF